MESRLERGEASVALNSASSSSAAAAAAAAVPCIARHKCHTCERTRSVRVRLLSWFLGKFSLLLIIVITSAATTFLYHKLLPDNVQHTGGGGAGDGASSSSSSSLSSSSTSSSSSSSGVGEERHEARHAESLMEGSSGRPGKSGRPHLPGQPPSLTAARLGLLTSKGAPYLRMHSEGPRFFTSGHVKLEEGALVVQRATTLFLSADVILNSMTSQGKNGPSTVVVCLSIARGSGSQDLKPVTCHLTYLRQRDQQMARVWMLFQGQAGDRIYVNTSWPSYVISDNRDNQQSVFQAFEV